MFKNLPTKLLFCYDSLFNYLLRFNHFPLKCKFTTIILLKKPRKNKTDPDCYRLLTTVSKIFEKVIYFRLFAYLNNTDCF